MHPLQAFKLPRIQRRFSARTIEQIIKNIDRCSLQKLNFMKGIHDLTPKNNKFARKSDLQKDNILIKKIDSLVKVKQDYANTLTTDTSRKQLQKSEEHVEHRACAIRSLIAKIVDKEMVVLQMKSHRQRNCKHSSDQRYDDYSRQNKNRERQQKIKSQDRSLTIDVERMKSQDFILERGRHKNKKAGKEMYNARNKINKPLSGVSKQCLIERFDEQIKPWEDEKGIF